MFREWFIRNKNLVLQNFPFLEDDFDALTDYQLFSKMCGYVIGYAKDNKEMKAKIEEFQHYFDNLDVQEEIDNKLDEMVTSGDLQEIINLYLDLTSLTFKTVSDMKLSDNLVNGAYVRTLGFYNVGDGGASYYLIRNKELSDTEDEHFLIALSDNTLVAEFYMIEKDLHSKQIGLKGDDVTDETTVIQQFFDYENNYEINKIFDSGIYVISSTIYVSGKDQQDGNNDSGWNNGYATIKFNDATFHHINSDEGDISFIFYKFWEDCIDGFTMTRNSGKTKTVFIGCTNLMFRNFEVKNIEFNTDPSLIDDTLRFYYDSEMYFENGYVRGQITYNPYSESTHYINVINFVNTKIYSYGYNSSIVLKGTRSKQQLSFNNCDIGGATLSVYDVEEEQVSAYITSGVSSCSIISIANYYDTNISLFKNNTHNNIRYLEFGTRYSGNQTQLETQTMDEYLTTTKIGIVSNYQKNQLPTTNLNLTDNGDISNNTVEQNQNTRLFGISSDDITKSYEASDYSRYGYVRRLTFNTTVDTYIVATGRKFPYTATATFGMLFEVVSGGCDIQVSIGNVDRQYIKIEKDKIKSGINFFNVCKNSQIFEQGAYSDVRIDFSNIDADTVIDIYEIGVQQGELYLLNAPLIESAKIE